MQSRLSGGGVKSFIAHVVGVAAGVVCGVAAAVVFSVAAPTAFAYAAVGGVALAAAYAGGRVGDGLYHWARGEEADSRNFVSHVKSHFAPAPAVAL